jgi:hypothetical protein
LQRAKALRNVTIACEKGWALFRFGPGLVTTFFVLLTVSGPSADEMDAIALPALPLTAEAIDDCVRENFPDETSRQFISFKVTDRSGLVDESTVETFWKRFPDGYWRLLVRFLGPPNIRGTSALMYERAHGTDIFVYLPDLRRVRRINKRTINGSIAGTDVTYEDWERLQGLAHDAELKRLPDAEVEGRPVYVIEARATVNDDSSYTRIVTWVDRRTCVALRTDIYEKGDRLRKVVTVPANAIWPERNGWISRYTRVEDRREGSQTEVFIDEIAMDEPLADKIFSQVVLDSASR